MTPRNHVPRSIVRERSNKFMMLTTPEGRQWCVNCSYSIYFDDQYFDLRPGKIEDFMKAHATGRYAYNKNALLVELEEDALLLWLTLGATK